MQKKLVRVGDTVFDVSKPGCRVVVAHWIKGDWYKPERHDEWVVIEGHERKAFENDLGKAA